VPRCIVDSLSILDGRVLSNDSTLSNKKTTTSQGYVTTISLLLTTAFRAALSGGVGVTYTQYLWVTLRKRLLKVQKSLLHMQQPG
jgi:ABC-type antimicrobial peptide transport system permease subunit